MSDDRRGQNVPIGVGGSVGGRGSGTLDHKEVPVTSMLRRAMLYLGLAPEEEYDDLEVVDARGRGDEPDTRSAGRVAEPEPLEPSGSPVVRSTSPQGKAAEPAAGPGAVRTISREVAQASGARIGPPRTGAADASVRTIPVSHAKPHVVAPTSFNDAQMVADRLKSEQPVIMNLQDVDRDLRRRLIDFASGLSYGLAARMDRIADGVYLLSPANVEVSEDERRRLQERGLLS